MHDVSRLVERVLAGETEATDELFPVVYDQLRRLARSQLANEPSGQSLQSADLVHEAYLRLVGSQQNWEGRVHFMAAAAEAMRRILVERARRRRRVKHGGALTRVELSDAATSLGPAPDEVIIVSDLLDSLATHYVVEAQIVKLHYFAGLSISEAGRLLGLSSSTAHRYWTFARAWLREALRSGNTKARPDEHGGRESE